MIEPFELLPGVQKITKIEDLLKSFLANIWSVTKSFAMWVKYWLESVYELSLSSRVGMYGGMANFNIDSAIWIGMVQT